ncbi:Hydroxypyruvate isomerase [Luteitalea pratensis]|uniref:Hydroxypyruvate isomerase n=1 Tax=Luteitalea pratensis TaxID=1855912 RepID=A0A143PV47_LUTPR|nr:Hydroxypyruvate isomerase [Luteitalea pratensis]
MTQGVPVQSSSSSLSRRSLLYLAGVAVTLPLVPVAGAGAAPAQAAATPRPLPLKIGVASYSLRKFPRDKAIAALKQLRVKYVTIKDVHLARTDTPEQIRAARKEFEDAGITIMGGGTLTWKTPDEAGMRKDFEYAKAAGMPLVVCSPAPDTLDLLEKMVKEFDIKAAIHNHGTEDPWWPAPSDVLKKIDKRDPRVGVCMDIGHATRAGADVVKTIALAGPRLLDLHIKDLADGTSRDSQVEVGRGILPVVAVFKELVRTKFQGHVSLEYEINADDPVPGMLESLSYMRGIAATLA